jgi:hypothetical protein
LFAFSAFVDSEEFKMKRTQIFAAFLCFVLLAGARCEGNQDQHKRMTNADIINLTQTGLTEDVIIAKIRAVSAADSTAVAFDTTLDGLKALKSANVSDAVIKVMINPASASVTIVSAATATPTTLDPNLPPPEVGVYWKDGSNFVLIQGQAISQSKVGGKAGSLFTYGMRGLHWDAFLNGPKSNNVVKERRPVFYLYVPDGTTSGDYVLLKLNKKDDRREFQVGTFGGATGGKSGVKRDKELVFNAEHVGIRTYKLTLDADLKPGEFGFFMGTGSEVATNGGRGGSRAGGSATGRIYDFSIPE